MVCLEQFLISLSTENASVICHVCHFLAASMFGGVEIYM